MATVVHHWDWRVYSRNSGIDSIRKIVVYSDEEMAWRILANVDPRRSMQRYYCFCPKIGRRYCPWCRGEGKYYNGDVYESQ